MHTFFGPWQVRATRGEGGAREGFVITGSDNADGLYETEAGAFLEVQVEGAEWTIELMALLPFEAGEWFSYEPHVTKRHRLPEGITTRLAMNEEGVKTFLGPFVITLELQCVCMDPVINPPTPAPPFDFTVPKM